MLLLNLLLALAWLALTGDFGPANLLAGFALGLFVLWVRDPRQGYAARLVQAAGFAVYFGCELLKANWRVARAVLQPRARLHPAIVAVPLEVRGDLAIQLLATVITLTPGTLSVDVSTDRRTLYVHVVDVGAAGDVEAFVRDTKASFERRIQAMLE